MVTLPYQRHQKQRQRNQKQETESSFNFSELSGKPFWIWDREEHLRLATETNEHCCFNHIVGLPVKDKIEHPIYDYEKVLYDSLLTINLYHSDFKDKHLWVKKATGLGVTEFMLRLMAWLCTGENHFRNCQMCIVTGPNIDIATKLIKRTKNIFERKLGLIFQDKETVLELNGCRIEAYPSNHLDAYRALENPKFILIDEGDFFRKSEQEDVRFVTERYIGKSDPYIVMVSTPNAPNGLFEKIEKEPESSCIYRRLKLDYSYGIGKIYTKEEIEKAKKSPSFGREYDLQYLGLIGNTFHTQDIDRAIAFGKKYNPNHVGIYSLKVMGIDPGWGSSAFGIVLLQVADGMIQVLYADEFERPRYEDMSRNVMDMIRGLNRRNIDQSSLDSVKIYVDGSNPEFISTLKQEVGETTRWDYIQEKILYCKQHNLDLARYMTVIPVPFSTTAKDMLMHTKELLEYERPLIAIHQKFDKLITSLRTAISSDDGKLDKEQTSYDNVLDAFRLACKGIKLVKKEVED